MTKQTVKLLAGRWAALTLCALAVPALAQTRAGGGGAGGGGGGFGGGGGGGAGGRTSAASTATTAAIDRPGNGQVGSANFYVDKDTGQVFVIADDATTKYVSEVISNLAKPKPQVLIKVVFLEVDYNKGLDVGVEGTVTKHINASTSNTVSSLFNLAPPNQGVVSGTTALSTLPGAGIYTIVGDDFSASLRAIETVGNVQILSRPTILARNNQMATIQVGYNYPLPTGIIAATTTAGPQTIITYTPVGIILNVTPNITSDGMVEMILAPSISTVDPTIGQVIGTTSTNNNGTPITAPAIDIESANTVVVTPDGQTVVIGGLMKNNTTTADNKIPLLGDIPGLGLLFHHKVKSTVKQELIILLTPYVVRTPSDLARMSQDERGRAKMAPKTFTQPELNQYLESGEPKAPPPAPASPLAKPPGPR